MASLNSFSPRKTLQVGAKSYEIFSLAAVNGLQKLPYALRILVENLLRTEDGTNITAARIQALANWDANAEPGREIQLIPTRVVMQDFTGVPCVVDLTTVHEAVKTLGGDPKKINPLAPTEIIINHSVQTDYFGRGDALRLNTDKEYEHNAERYKLLCWRQGTFNNFRVVPSGTGIICQMNIEYLVRTVFAKELPDGTIQAYPDTCAGTGSHTTVVNGLGVLGWGVGGIEAEAAMLGQPVSMLIPCIVGFKLKGTIPAAATAIDMVLAITQMLCEHGMVGKFVEFYDDGVPQVPLANRVTINNMPSEFGSTAAIFLIDQVAVSYLRLTGRNSECVALVEAYAKEQGLWRDPSFEPKYPGYLELDLSTVIPSIVGSKHPQDRILFSEAKGAFEKTLVLTYVSAPHCKVEVTLVNGTQTDLGNGRVVIASITSCTNTSNPSVMTAASLLARNARARGLNSKPWVRTSVAPGSQVVTNYFDEVGLWEPLNELGFNLVECGYATCIGNSGPLPAEISEAINDNDLTVCAVLSGNRNFEGRISPDVKMGYLASPPFVVAYALADSTDFDFETEPLGQDQAGKNVLLHGIQPDPTKVQRTIDDMIDHEMYLQDYTDIFADDERWQGLPAPQGDRFTWDDASTYACRAPFFDKMKLEPEPVADIKGARVLLKLGDPVTTDHISSAGTFKPETPTRQYLGAHGVAHRDFNSYGSHRGNHEVMICGTFTDIRIENRLFDGVESGPTRDFTQPGVPQAYVYNAAMHYQAAGTPLVVLGGKEYGSGPSRDWAAKGTRLLGVKAVIAESSERIHRSNSIGIGTMPLQFPAGGPADSLGLDGTESLDITGVTALNQGIILKTLAVMATKTDGPQVIFDVVVRIDTPGEAGYYHHDGILRYVLHNLVTA